MLSSNEKENIAIKVANHLVLSYQKSGYPASEVEHHQRILRAIDELYPVIYSYSNESDSEKMFAYMDIEELIEKKTAAFKLKPICDNCEYCGNGKNGKLVCVKTAYKKPKYYNDSKRDMPIHKYVNQNDACRDFKMV